MTIEGTSVVDERVDEKEMKGKGRPAGLGEAAALGGRGALAEAWRKRAHGPPTRPLAWDRGTVGPWTVADKAQGTKEPCSRLVATWKRAVLAVDGCDKAEHAPNALKEKGGVSWCSVRLSARRQDGRDLDLVVFSSIVHAPMIPMLLPRPEEMESERR